MSELDTSFLLRRHLSRPWHQGLTKLRSLYFALETPAGQTYKVHVKVQPPTEQQLAVCQYVAEHGSEFFLAALTPLGKGHPLPPKRPFYWRTNNLPFTPSQIFSFPHGITSLDGHTLLKEGVDQSMTSVYLTEITLIQLICGIDHTRPTVLASTTLLRKSFIA